MRVLPASRQRAVELVDRLLRADFATEEKAGTALGELERLVPDPRVSDLIFRPNSHPLTAESDDGSLTAEAIVDLALRYEPFAL